MVDLVAKEKKSMKKLSKSQLAALHAAAGQKLSRSARGWGFEDSEGRWQVCHAATIEALCKRGLLDSNFTDERIFRGDCWSSYAEPKPVTHDGAFHAHSPEVPKFQVWANAHGNEVLRLALADKLKDMRLH